MATSQGTIEFILDQLSDLAGVRARKMFGEYALYYDEKVVALVCDNQLFVKITQLGKDLLGERFQEGEAYPGDKPSILIGAEDLEDSDSLSQLIRVTASALPQSKPRNQTKTGPGTKRRHTRREPGGRRPADRVASSPGRGLMRGKQPMPTSVRKALVEAGLMDAYRARPPYQQNDYLGWINRAKRDETRARRLRQMLDELERGDRYMKMVWRGPSRVS